MNNNWLKRAEEADRVMRYKIFMVMKYIEVNKLDPLSITFVHDTVFININEDKFGHLHNIKTLLNIG